MNSPKTNTKGHKNMNSPGKTPQSNLDSTVQERYDSDKPRKGKPISDIVLAPEETIAVPKVATWPNKFMQMGRTAQAAPSASDIISSLLRFKWTIIIIFVLVSVPAVALIWTQAALQYRAQAHVRVRPIIPYLVFKTEDSGMIPLYGSFLKTQVSIIKSSLVLRRALERQELEETQWHKHPSRSLMERLLGNPPEPPIERLQNTLSVREREGTELIDVSLIDDSAKDAKIVLDMILEEYIRYIGEMSDADEDKLYRQLTDQFTSLQTQIQGQEEVIAKLRGSIGTQNPEELISSKRDRLDEKQNRLSQLRQTMAILKWERQTSTDSNGVPIVSTIDLENKPLYSEDTEWRQLDRDVRTIQHDISTSFRRPNHPDMLRLKKDLEFAETLLQQRETQLDEQWRHSLQDTSGGPAIVTQWRSQPINILGAFAATTPTEADPHTEETMSVAHQLARLKYEEQILAKEYTEQQEEFRRLTEKAQLLEKENNALLHKRELFDAVRQRLDQKNMERNVSAGSIDVPMKAHASSQPYNDRRIVLTAMSLVLGIGLGGGLAFLRANRNPAVYTLKDMPYPMQVPFLGHVPVTDTTRSQKKSNKTSLDGGQQNESHLIESVRHVRTTLLSRLSHQDNAVLLITSAVPGTGKSHFTMTLGESFARVGKKVLVIDADLRKNTLTQRLNLFGKSGFTESLCSISADKRNIFPTETLGLSIMPAGKQGVNGSVFEETANGAFKACMAQLRKQYDIILLDSSPILPAADATILSSQVDGTVMVERELISKRDTQTEALTRLISSGGRLLGTVFVGSENRIGYDYRYAYGQV